MSGRVVKLGTQRKRMTTNQYRLGKRRPAHSSTRMATIQRPLKGSTSKTYSYRQFVYSTTISQTAGSDTIGALGMVFSQLPNQTDLAAIYDSYKISYCEFTFRPTTSLADQVAVLSVPVVNRAGVIYVAIDKDDASTLGQLSYLQEYQNVEVHNTGQTFTIRFKPGVMTGIYNGTTIVSGGLKISPWLDCAQVNLPHNGLKYGITAAPSSALALCGWRVDLYCGIKFKNVR